MRNLRPRDKELLRELADGGLLDIVLERAELKLFNQFKSSDDGIERLELGATCDALKAVTVELQKATNEALRDERTDNANAA